VAVFSTQGRQILERFRPAAPAVSLEDRAHLLLVQLQARLVLWTAQQSGHNGHELDANALALNNGPVDQRLRFVVLAGDLAGPAEALHYQEDLNQKLAANQIELTPAQRRLEAILRRLYRDYARGRWQAPSVSAEQRAWLQSQLGWFGDLALAPAGGPDTAARAEVLAAAQQTSLAVVAAGVIFVLLALGGVIGLVVLMSLLASGKLHGGLRCGYADGAIYAETFAWWMVIYVGLSVGAGVVAPADQKLLWSGVAMLLSLGVLVWPVVRGIPWQRVREQIGLVPGRNPALEPAVGVGVYITALPLLAVALVLVAVLMQLQQHLPGRGPAGDNFGEVGPAHPVVVFAASADWWQRLQVLLLASVVAPIVEETMFRGVLYRHLREATTRCGRIGSVLLSATFVSFFFAALHPQGWLGVPLLMTLAFSFALMREWRVSLVPSMTAHALNNGAVMLLVMLAMGG
jgi:membrane protease YdiL (CAAX protease family)